eukprot:CAMPEP_0178912398 /NCGR_PEP_ID=MMETSP0786-20121207/10239_1 /TAXON_ID=186022 /ORGANISM="Thalassionema frauenfeldii, Strain CCMP 1798" /LENGTH=354 /DNA_ID=CAMNT_0020584973 /DNA_START=114 /DNA_END=1178 /DNA_ORIENTATION=+
MFPSKSLLVSIFFLLGPSTSNAATSFGRKSSVFAVPRGGGLFGGGNKDAATKAEGGTDLATAASAEGLPTYPAMDQEEIEAWLDHVPVFAVTDSQGQGVVMKPDDSSNIVYFFLSPVMANTTLTQLKTNKPDMDLTVSSFSLGKIWFNMLNAGEDKEVMLKAPGSEEGTASTSKDIEYRVVPDSRDLMGARMLLTMKPEDQEKLQQSGEMTPEIAQDAIKRAMTEAPKFNATFNEIPVFLISQMRMQKQASKEGDEAVTLLPMYFSLQNMVTTWQQFMAQAPADVQGTEPAINLMSLHEMVDLMQKESPIDFRNVVLIPSAPIGEGGPDASAGVAPGTPAVESPMGGGSTLGDL